MGRLENKKKQGDNIDRVLAEICNNLCRTAGSKLTGSLEMCVSIPVA
jgi:hypothetical protein